MDTQRFQQVLGNYQFVNHYDAICQTVDYYRNVLLLAVASRHEERVSLVDV